MSNGQGSIPEKVRLQYDALLRELHNIDHITEIHTATVIAISAALLAFVANNPENFMGMILIALVGLAISIEWMLKLQRHRQIFDDVLQRLRELQNREGFLNGLRPPPNPGKFTGFQILSGLAVIITVIWVGVFLFAVKNA